MPRKLNPSDSGTAPQSQHPLALVGFFLCGMQSLGGNRCSLTNRLDRAVRYGNVKSGDIIGNAQSLRESGVSDSGGDLVGRLSPGEQLPSERN